MAKVALIVGRRKGPGGTGAIVLVTTIIMEFLTTAVIQ